MRLYTKCSDVVFVTTEPDSRGYRTVIHFGPLDGTVFFCNGDPQEQHDGAVWLARSNETVVHGRPLGVESPQYMAYI